MTSQTITRRGRGKAAATIQLEEAIRAIVEERAPITVRGVCYALFTRDLLPDMSVNSTGKVSRVMTEMRESGALDWTLIVDGSRAVERISAWSDPSAIIDCAVKEYRRNNWQDQPHLVEVWSEKSTVHGVLQPVLDDLGVTFRVMKGFGSFTAVRGAAEDSVAIAANHVCAYALYLGDYDPSGLYMSEVDIPARLTRYESRWEFQRIALTTFDCFDLPSFETEMKRGDTRADWYRKHTANDPAKCWELDAMNPNDLRERVRGAITRRMDMDKWNHALKIEAAERASMEDFHQAWQARLRLA